MEALSFLDCFASRSLKVDGVRFVGSRSPGNSAIGEVHAYEQEAVEWCSGGGERSESLAPLFISSGG